MTITLALWELQWARVLSCIPHTRYLHCWCRGPVQLAREGGKAVTLCVKRRITSTRIVLSVEFGRPRARSSFSAGQLVFLGNSPTGIDSRQPWNFFSRLQGVLTHLYSANHMPQSLDLNWTGWRVIAHGPLLNGPFSNFVTITLAIPCLIGEPEPVPCPFPIR